MAPRPSFGAVTRQTVEILTRSLRPDSDAFVTRQTVEVMTRPRPDILPAVTRQVVEVLVSGAGVPLPVAVTLQRVEVLVSNVGEPQPVTVTRQAVEVLVSGVTAPSPPTSTEAQVTRQVVEVLVAAAGEPQPVAVTRQVVEVLVSQGGTPQPAAVSRQVVEVLVSGGARWARATRQTVEIMRANVPADVFVTRQVVEVMALLPVPTPPVPIVKVLELPACPPGTLGNGSDTRVVLMTRGGGKVLAELTPNDGHFTRVLDDTSILEMTGTIGGKLEVPCCDDYAELHAWATEILVIRDERDAWCGPVTDINWSYGNVEIEAADLSVWWDVRRLPNLSLVNLDLADIFVAYHQAAMARDTSPNFNLVASPTGVIGSRSVLATDEAYARDRLDELATSAVDWTAYGRAVLVGGQEIPADPGITLTDEHFDVPPSVHERGNEQANYVVVRGANGIVGIAYDQTYIDFYGLLERSFDEPTIQDQASANAAAMGRLLYLREPTYLEPAAKSTLKPSAPVTLPQLIPGVRVRLESTSTCRKITQDFRLFSVDATLRDGRVSPTFQPLGDTGVDPAGTARLAS